MSQNIIALPTTGTFTGLQEQNYINSALDTLNTKWAGASAPSGAGITLETGQDWLNTNVSTALVWNLYDGSNWLPAGVLDTTNHIWTPPVGGGVIPTIASTTSVNLGGVPQSRKYVSGTANIQNFGTAAPIGTWHSIKFLSGLTITASSSLVTLSGSNMVVNAGDETEWTYDAANVWKCTYWSGGSALPNMTAYTVLANTSGSTAQPTATSYTNFHNMGGSTATSVPYLSGTSWVNTTLSTILDLVVGSTVGGVAVRGTSVWTQQTQNVVYNSIAGCLPSSITGTNTSASISVSAGQAADSTNTVYLACTGYSWAASNGNAINGTDASSSTLANSTTYHVYLITGTSGTGTFASATFPYSSVTFPAGYRSNGRRIFSFNTNSSGAPIPYTAIEAEGGATINWLTTQILDINGITFSTSSRTLYALTVPTGIKVLPIGRASFTGSAGWIATSGDETDVAPVYTTSNNWTTAPGTDAGAVNGDQPSAASGGILTTTVSGQIGIRGSSAVSAFYWVTRGFKDFRRS